MKSKFRGLCALCKQSFPAGEEIHYSKTDGAAHQSCWDSRAEELPFDKEEAEKLADDLGFQKFDYKLGPRAGRSAQAARKAKA